MKGTTHRSGSDGVFFCVVVIDLVFCYEYMIIYIGYRTENRNIGPKMKGGWDAIYTCICKANGT